MEYLHGALVSPERHDRAESIWSSMTSQAYVGRPGSSLGPLCSRELGGCGQSEALCARNYPCCSRCSHFGENGELDEEPRRGRPPRPKKPLPPAQELPEVSNWDWLVAVSGLAHLHYIGDGVQRTSSSCGLANMVEGATPVTAWPFTCKSCLRRASR